MISFPEILHKNLVKTILFIFIRSVWKRNSALHYGVLYPVNEGLLCVSHCSIYVTFVTYPVKVNIPIFQKKRPKFTEEIYLRLNGFKRFSCPSPSPSCVMEERVLTKKFIKIWVLILSFSPTVNFGENPLSSVKINIFLWKIDVGRNTIYSTYITNFFC